MKFKKVLKEASAELKGQPSPHNLTFSLGGKKGVSLEDMKYSAPNSFIIIKKAINYAVQNGINVTTGNQPDDVTIMGNGTVKITDDISGKESILTLDQLGISKDVRIKMKKELGI